MQNSTKVVHWIGNSWHCISNGLANLTKNGSFTLLVFLKFWESHFISVLAKVAEVRKYQLVLHLGFLQSYHKKNQNEKMGMALG